MMTLSDLSKSDFLYSCGAAGKISTDIVHCMFTLILIDDIYSTNRCSVASERVCATQSNRLTACVVSDCG